MDSSTEKKKQGMGRTICTIVNVVLFVGIVFLSCRYCAISIEQRSILSQLISKIDNIEAQQAAASSLQLISEAASISYFTDELSTIFQIIAVGIAVFSVFGATVSLINIHQYERQNDKIEELKQIIETERKELEKARQIFEEAQTTIENINEKQKAISLHRVLQDGRSYAQRKRPKYAEDLFREILTSNDSDRISELTARVERFSLYADNFPQKRQDLEKIDGERDLAGMDSFMEYLSGVGKRLLNRLESEDVQKLPEGHMLKADFCFTMGCLYGNYICCHLDSKTQKKQIKELQDKEINYFNQAIHNDPENVDFHIHRAMAFAASGNLDACKKDLNFADGIAWKYPVYLELTRRDRISKIFNDMKDRIPSNIRSCLVKDYGIQFSDNSGGQSKKVKGHLLR